VLVLVSPLPLLFPLQISSIVEEYFASGDVANVAQSLEELGAPASMSHYFVKRLVTLALDRKGREREMASVLLSGLYGEVRQGWRTAAGCAGWLWVWDDGHCVLSDTR
jgi:programmed cell death protein 4